MDDTKKLFLYIFTDKDGAMLIKHGVNLLKRDERNCMYIFENTDVDKSLLNNVIHIYSDKILF